MYRIVFAFLLILILSSYYEAQSDFRSPVQGNMQLSGTFGELRNNHFHAGIDIKSKNGRAGDPIYAIKEGFVSRIRVSASGYGNAVYLDHPNGYTSVYAHLQTFSPELDSFVLSMQKRHETFELDIYPSPDLLTVRAGQIIGRMGNTGSSSGVHLHFEIRETESESPINPLKWKFPYTDDAPPFASRIYLYKKIRDDHIVMVRSYKLGGAYHDRSPWPRNIKVPAGEYGIAIRAYDPFNGWRNQNGLYSCQLKINEKEHFSFAMDSIPFHHSRHINAHIDHEHYCEHYSRLHRLFRLKRNTLPIYQADVADGWINIEQGDSLSIDMILSDKSGKTSQIQFQMLGNEPAHDSLQLKLFPPHKDSLIRFEKGSIYIPHYTFYEAVKLLPSSTWSKDSLPIIGLEENCEAQRRDLVYSFVLPEIADSLKAKTFIGEIKGSSITDRGGEWRDSLLSGPIRSLGMFSVFTDTIGPRIQLVRGYLSPGANMSYRLTDNYKSSFRHRDLYYSVYINGDWWRATFDKRSRRLNFRLPMDFNKEKDRLEIHAMDRLGNKTIRKYEP